jgi:hypothetical protein
MTVPRSEALEHFSQDIQPEYTRLLGHCEAEIAPVEGTDTVLEMLLERYVFTYCALRQMEKDWERLDTQRYNQLLGIWVKIGGELFRSYREVFEKGALKDIFIQKIMTIVTEEVIDEETITRIRQRIAAAAKDEPVAAA